MYRLRVAIGGVGLSLLLASAGGAQEPAELQRRIARLSELLRTAERRAAIANNARREPVDTVRAGALIILVRADDAGLARQAAGVAWARLDSLYGDDARLLATRPLLFWILTRPIRYLAAHGGEFQPVMADPSATVAHVENQLADGGALALRVMSDSALADWLAGPLRPSTQRDAERTRVYVELVTAPSVAVRRCYAGEPEACRAALGLLDRKDGAALWYDAAERRALVRKAATELFRFDMRTQADACLIGRADDACLAVLREFRFLEPPLSIEARHSFARLALETGGREAYARLRGTAGRALPERWALAAGIPSDSLVTRWRAMILAARPTPVTLPPAAGWVALGWAVVFGFLALRSSRWR